MQFQYKVKQKDFLCYYISSGRAFPIIVNALENIPASQGTIFKLMTMNKFKLKTRFTQLQSQALD